MATELPPIVGETLDATGGLLDGLYRRIESAISRQLGRVWSTIQDVAGTYIGPIADRLTSTADAISDYYQRIRDGIESGLDSVQARIRTYQDTVTSAIDAGLQRIGDTVTQLASSYIPPIDAALERVQETLTGIVPRVLAPVEDRLRDVASTLTSTLSQVEEYLGSQTLYVLSELRDTLTHGVEQARETLLRIPTGLWEAISPDVQERLTPLIERLENNPEVTPELLALTRPGALPVAVVGAVIAGIALPLILSSLITTVLEPLTAKLQQAEARKIRSTLLSPSDLISGYQRGVIPWEQALEELRRQGYTEEDIGHLQQMGVRWPDEVMLTTAWHRGYLSEEALVSLFRRLGWDSEWAELYKRLSWAYPSISDLIRMAVREAFSPEVVQRFALDADYPPEFDEIASRAGLSPEWARNYWRAHWELPSPSQGYEMFQRTVDAPLDPHADEITLPSGRKVYNIIGRRTLEMLLRTLDVMPYWRDKMIQLSYVPLTRVDIRRMHKLGILDEDGVYRAHLDLGYSPEHAQYLTQFTLLLNRAEAREEEAPERDLSRSDILSLYREGYLDADQARQYLLTLGYDETEAGYLIAQAHARQLMEDRKEQLENVRLRYQKGVITLPDAESELTRMGLSARETETLLLRWERTRPVTVRYPTIGQLDGMLRQRIITSDEYYQTLVEMGYSPAWATRLTSLAMRGKYTPEQEAQVGTEETGQD